MTTTPQFVLRDAQGRLFGPASLILFRQWAAEGRLTPTMEIAPEGSAHWRSIMTQPELAEILSAAPALRPPPAAPHTSNAAIASVACSLVGLLMFCPYPLALCALGMPAATLGIILGLLAQNHIRASRGRQTGAGLATLGIALGCLALFLTLTTIAILWIFHPEMLPFMSHPPR